ncbi:hypothetical protein BFG57_09715 [Bacillus solimangrovi]|uniref:YrhK domain-containing protein n=1 Tax=Bacillus solimangrovi TaxID=1305675 RepID=A0A1E5LJ57_9BACI|nr:hypothetical protein BFG57_09715 [Bacillus solimangrovi]
MLNNKCKDGSTKSKHIFDLLYTCFFIIGIIGFILAIFFPQFYILTGQMVIIGWILFIFTKFIEKRYFKNNADNTL